MIFSFIGPRGAGKTTLAAELVEALGWKRFYSTDREVESAAGKTIAQIVAEKGWLAFRELEHQALAGFICRHEDEETGSRGVLLDTGGGIVVKRENRTLLLKAGYVIYLTAPPEVLVGRIRDDPSRPPLTEAGDPLTEMKRVLAEREPIYRQLAHLTVDTNDLGVAACVTILQQWVNLRCGTCSL